MVDVSAVQADSPNCGPTAVSYYQLYLMPDGVLKNLLNDNGKVAEVLIF